MKCVIFLGDGMSDEKMPELAGRTPLQVAKTTHMDKMARDGKLGLVKTIPEGFTPGSDIGNLSILGYDPRTCYCGRAAFEAAGMGVKLSRDDVAFRLNLVTLRLAGGETFMEDHSAGHISDADGRELVELLQSELGNAEFQFYAGLGYRHLMVWRGGTERIVTTQPQDIIGKDITNHLPRGERASEVIKIMNASRTILTEHPQYKRRMAEHKHPVSSIWPWGQGKSPHLVTLRERTGLNGAVICAVNLIQGIGICAGLTIVRVPGATGDIDTNYQGKAEAALRALETHDLVYIHVEAPDEASHDGNLPNKLRAIELFDSLVVGRVLRGLDSFGKFQVLCTTDHSTPVRLRAHTTDPVPFVFYNGKSDVKSDVAGYDEESAKSTGFFVAEGHQLINMFIKHD
ncbi:MAG: cofactor-independent phosphoglycerate mutase [Candidatus Bathyarchaeia archaeon]